MICVTGSETILGRAVLRQLDGRNDVIAFGGRVEDLPADTAIIVNCHQAEDVDRLEYFREEAYGENAFAAGRVARQCAERGILMVQAGTTQVFGGHNDRPWREDDTPEPVNVYGDSKLLAEELIRESSCPHIIIRFPLLYDAHESPFHRAIRMSHAGECLVVMTRRRFAPLPASMAARALLRVMETDFRGIVHYAASDGVDEAHFVRYGLDRVAARFPGCGAGCEEREVEEHHRPADRPLWEVVDTDTYSRLCGENPPYWHQALETYIENEFVPPDFGG